MNLAAFILSAVLVVTTGAAAVRAEKHYGDWDKQLIAASQKDVVIYNTKTDKYHIPSCSAAKRCTVNCIPLTRGEAKQRGGVPCKLCGAGE